ncbi:Putative NAD(P)H nitroreductase YdjA [Defluviimonas aquaemixtae]|uniref:Putative NAD(P)H nitroreductase n=1 Tax=Albidovulum aquaemixtae TaxID=1542388 RepID=A0A2R8B7U0_9RHOB|nr:nitroreductase [Defluviimonas aquaemixtae]SPH18639.1 Putative NAD(P)H nitroreductase YdjA [Defluviimonas aquaemixtae]
MPDPNPAAMDFFLTRRSRPAKILTAPVPDREALTPILTAAARVPDHGKLVPWRFVVLEKAALLRLATLARKRGNILGIEPERVEKGVSQFADAELVVAVIHVPRSTEKVPEIEQILSAGAVCVTLLNAALASGWGACWLTGWHVHDPDFCRKGLRLAPGEWVAGVIHLGTERHAPPDRPRPDIADITEWVST